MRKYGIWGKISFTKNCSQTFSSKSERRGTARGAFTNYVYKICLFLTTYPPPLVNVVCERPLIILLSSLCRLIYQLLMGVFGPDRAWILQRFNDVAFNINFPPYSPCLTVSFFKIHLISINNTVYSRFSDIRFSDNL